MFHFFLVAAVQGVTEFLPVSSSGHLIILPQLARMQDQGQTADIAAHVGSLGAIIIYIRNDIGRVALGAAHILQGRTRTQPARIAYCLVIATIPVVLAGGVLQLSGAVEMLRNLAVVGWATLLFGIVLYWTDSKGPTNRKSGDWRTKDAIAMGLWQVVALVPGASRAGVVISGARLLGFDRQDAARLSMLMSVPTIFAAGTLAILDAIASGERIALLEGAVVAGVSFITALVAVIAMMRLLARFSFLPFVVYRVFLGCALILASWGLF